MAFSDSHILAVLILVQNQARLLLQIQKEIKISVFWNLLLQVTEWQDFFSPQISVSLIFKVSIINEISTELVNICLGVVKDQIPRKISYNKSAQP